MAVGGATTAASIPAGQWLPESRPGVEYEGGYFPAAYRPRPFGRKPPAPRYQTPADTLVEWAPKLTGSEAYRNATAEERKLARAYLREVVGREDVDETMLDPNNIIRAVRARR